MAGFYPDYPSWRMAYDRDGTQLFYINNALTITQLTNADMLKVNNESNDYLGLSSSSQYGALVFIFPELRDIDAYAYMQGSGSLAGTITAATSADTTNGVDGTWTTLGSTFIPPTDTNVIPGYRTTITTAAVNGVKAIRFSHASQSARYQNPSTIHLFGEISTGQNPDRLILWHPTLDERVGPAHFDWGDTPRSTTADKTFRVKNNSSTLQANGVRVATEVLTDATVSLLTQHAFSLDGTNFAAEQTIGDLAAGAISGTVTLRRTTTADAQLSAWALRVFSDATSWS